MRGHGRNLPTRRRVVDRLLPPGHGDPESAKTPSRAHGPAPPARAAPDGGYARVHRASCRAGHLRRPGRALPDRLPAERAALTPDATRNVEKLREVFGIDRALDITADRIAAYTARRLEFGMKPASVNRELAALRRMFTLAIRAGKLATRPHIALLAEDNAREGFLEPADFAALRAHLPPGSLMRRLRLPDRLAETRGDNAHVGGRRTPRRRHPAPGRAQQEQASPIVVMLRGELRDLLDAGRARDADSTARWSSTATASRSATSGSAGARRAAQRVRRAALPRHAPLGGPQHGSRGVPERVAWRSPGTAPAPCSTATTS